MNHHKSQGTRVDRSWSIGRLIPISEELSCLGIWILLQCKSFSREIDTRIYSLNFPHFALRFGLNIIWSSCFRAILNSMGKDTL